MIELSDTAIAVSRLRWCQASRGGVSPPYPRVAISQSMITCESNSVRPSTIATGTFQIGDSSRSMACPASACVSTQSIGSPSSAATIRTRRVNGDAGVPKSFMGARYREPPRHGIAAP